MEYRKAVFGDVETIYDIVKGYADSGDMLVRSRNTLFEI